MEWEKTRSRPNSRQQQAIPWGEQENVIREHMSQTESRTYKLCLFVSLFVLKTKTVEAMT